MLNFILNDALNPCPGLLISNTIYEFNDSLRISGYPKKYDIPMGENICEFLAVINTPIHPLNILSF